MDLFEKLPPSGEDEPGTPAVVLPDKEYFKIGEVARLVGVESYVLRFWEGEFSREIRPERTRSNQRMYRRKDVETFLRIKRLRYEEKLELPGARDRLREEARRARSAKSSSVTVEASAPLPPSLSPEIARQLRISIEELIRVVDEDERGE